MVNNAAIIVIPISIFKNDNIPIVIKNKAYDSFKNMKILFIKDWNEITNSFLEEKYIEFNNKKYNNEIAYIDYWEKEIINN